MRTNSERIVQKISGKWVTWQVSDRSFEISDFKSLIITLLAFDHSVQVCSGDKHLLSHIDDKEENQPINELVVTSRIRNKITTTLKKKV